MPLTRERLERLRKAMHRATRAPWIIEALDLDDEGKALLEAHPGWQHSPWHTVVGWSDADRSLLLLLVRELPDLLDAAEAVFEDDEEPCCTG